MLLVIPAMADADYLKPYRKAQTVYGSDFDVTLWASETTQRKRFEVFRDMLPLTGKIVLDAGCSRADFAAFLLQHGVEYGKYIGVDGIEQVLAYARDRDLPRAEYYHGDLVTDRDLLAIGPPEVTVISGTLNTMKYGAAVKLLEHAWAGCTQTLAFNFLSDRCDTRAPRQAYPARRLPAMRLFDWALKKTWDVRYRQDYFPFGHDATIVMQKRD
ncbi:MAG: hypothetical protein ACOC1G_09395 [Phycisphaeraceae bacterium]